MYLKSKACGGFGLERQRAPRGFCAKEDANEEMEAVLNPTETTQDFCHRQVYTDYGEGDAGDYFHFSSLGPCISGTLGIKLGSHQKIQSILHQIRESPSGHILLSFYFYFFSSS